MPPAFDRASTLRKDLDRLERYLSAPDSVLLPVWRGQPLVESGASPQLHLPDLGAAPDWIDRAAELAFLGLLQDRACFAVALDDAQSPSATGAPTEPFDLRLAAGSLPGWQAMLGGYARALLHWHHHCQYCSRCGAPTRPRAGGHERVCERGDCGQTHFPRTDPVVLVLVHHRDRVLLGRQAGWPPGLYSALAGFVEPGEAAEEAAAREVREETGVVIGPPRYAHSQAWPFPGSLMLGFYAEAQDDRLAPDDDELQDARWVPREVLSDPARGPVPGFFTPPMHTLAGQLLAGFLAGDR